MTENTNPIRRRLIGLSMASLACGITSPALAARMVRPAANQTDRHLTFHNLHTDEKLAVSYWKNGTYDRAAWAKINHILRDHYSGNARVMDLRLIDLLHDVQLRVGNDRPVEIISGYRSPFTNQRLAEASGGVAKNSFHMRGMAMDIRLNGTSLPHLHNTALSLGRGGVGYYPDSQFVHIDVGPVRRWG